MVKVASKLILSFILGLGFIVHVHAAPAPVPEVNAVNLEELSTQNLTKEEQKWFMEEFPRSFMSVYQDKTFVVTKNDKPTILGPENIEEKKVWLTDTAKEEFQNFVLSPQKGHKAILIQYKNQPIGALLYRLIDKKQKTLYLAQLFILPEYQKKGIGHYLLLTILPKLHPDYKQYEVLARHQNDAAILLYTNAGFSLGNAELVKKYDYDPLRYMGFYKQLK